MRSFWKNIAFYLLIAVISIFMFNYFLPTQEEYADIDYSELIQHVEQGNITRVTIVGETLVTGQYKGKQFKVNVPSGSMDSLIQRFEAKGINIETKPEPESPWWAGLLGYIFPTLLLIGVWIFFMQRMQGGGNRVMSFGKSRARLHSSEKKKVTFDDVANYEEVKEELQEVVEFLKNPHRFNQIGAKIPKGVLLVGPPGTGKTLMARAVAGEAGVPFYIISGSDFVEMFVGVGASRVRDLFEQGKKNAPCIIFIDELDAVGRQRGAGLGGGHDEREQTLNQLLVEMDGFEPNEGIIIMAATNRPDVLDPALLRPGRFDRQIIVDKPDYKGRKGILKIHVRNKPLADDVDLEVLAKRTPGFTGADLENLANEAAILTARRHKRAIGMTEFDDAIDRIIAGPQKKSRIINEKERDIVAYHEMGHALMGELLEHADPIHKVSIVPRGRAGGFTIPLPEDDKNFMTKQQLLDEVTVLLGGRASEELFLDDISTGAQNDLERATKIVRAMVTEFGMSDEIGPLTLGNKHDEPFLGRDLSRDRNYSEDVAAAIDNEIRSIIEQCYATALQTLREHASKAQKIVEALKERETLTAKEIHKLMEGLPLNGQAEDESEEELAATGDGGMKEKKASEKGCYQSSGRGDNKED
ncbi:MAG: ATP-dependent zinc metalloprotease FtsH [Halanaerobium sp.]|nr:ATP-dependent zinc metalloprotease FtsH [Halanaerobium sp.]